MSKFGELLAEYTAEGANIIPGVILSATNRDGKILVNFSNHLHMALYDPGEFSRVCFRRLRTRHYGKIVGDSVETFFTGYSAGSPIVSTLQANPSTPRLPASRHRLLMLLPSPSTAP
jgi:hypothetical protein